MRITLIKYISKEIWAIFLTCVLVFLFIFMATEMLNLTGFMVNYGAGLADILNLMLCLIPGFLLHTMPAACLMAVLLSFIRMASDNEIVALHSSGISVYQLMPPVVIFSITSFLFTGFLTMFWAPYGNRTFESASVNLIKTGIESRIKEGVFTEIGDFEFYVNSYSPKDKIMKDVFVVDKSEGDLKTYVAKRALFVPGENKVRVMDYKVFYEGDGGEWRIFETKLSTDFPIPIESLMESSKSDELEPDEMYLEELLQIINNNSAENTREKNIAKLKMYEMFSLPAAVFLISIAGAPLGAQIRARGRTKGIIISLLLFLSYYIILTSVEYICENGILNPAIGVWLPVLFLAIISVSLLVLPKVNFSINSFNRMNLYDTPRRA